MFAMVQNFALPFWKLSAFVCRIEISEILNCFVDLNVATALPLDALRRLMPSAGILVYSMEGLFLLMIYYPCKSWTRRCSSGTDVPYYSALICDILNQLIYNEPVSRPTDDDDDDVLFPASCYFLSDPYIFLNILRSNTTYVTKTCLWILQISYLWCHCPFYCEKALPSNKTHEMQTHSKNYWKPYNLTRHTVSSRDKWILITRICSQYSVYHEWSKRFAVSMLHEFPKFWKMKNNDAQLLRSQFPV